MNTLNGMQIADAIQLIKEADINEKAPSVWADLGCGSGVFTEALADLLPKESVVYAVDKLRQSIPQHFNGNQIKFVQADFEQDVLPLPPLDGILMANSLHYIQDKETLIKRLQKHFHSDGMFIVVEYDSHQANPWVPYPIDYRQLKELFSGQGFMRFAKLGVRRSAYRQGNIYACMIFKF